MIKIIKCETTDAVTRKIRTFVSVKSKNKNAPCAECALRHTSNCLDELCEDFCKDGHHFEEEKGES